MRVLLIEDDGQVARVVALELGHAGFDVKVEASGREGVAEALSGAYDLVVLDLGLPDLDGMAVCRAIRAVSSARILMLTARDALEDRVAGLEAGADDYVVKPFAPRELVARARALTRRPAAIRSADDPLVLGSWHISPRRRQVQVGGRSVELTRREFDLLLYFAENPGLTLTRDMILDRVWGYGYGGSSNVVDVYIGYLRQKLTGAAPGSPEIVTIRGVGYRLDLPADLKP